MRTQNIIEFIRRGLSFKPEAKNFRKLMLFMLSFPIICVLLAFVIESRFRFLAGVALLVWISAFISVIIISRRILTVKKQLLITAIMYLTITVQLFVLSVLCYLIQWRINTYLILLVAPVIIIPILFCIRENIRINKNKPAYKKRFEAGKVVVSTFYTGIASVILSRYISRHFSTFPIFTVAALFFMMVCYLICCEFPFNLMRLYYLTKLEKQGLVTEESFSFDEKQSNAK